MSVRTTIRTIERGIRYANKDAESEPVEEVKRQLNSFVRHSAGEKNDLNKLNDRMALYVDRVKQLENENFKLLREIQDVQSRWGDDTRLIKNQFESDLYDMRSRIDDMSNARAYADIRAKRATYNNNDLQQRYEEIMHLKDTEKYKILNIQNEIEQSNSNLSMLAKAIEDEKNDIKKYRMQQDELNVRLKDLMNRVDDEVLKRVGIEYNNQTLREHIEFLRHVHAKEQLEMSQLTDALPFTDQMEFYKDQLKRVVANIRKDYEQLHHDQTREIQEWMRVKTEEISQKHRERDPLQDLEFELHAENCENLRSSYGSAQQEMDDLRRHNEMLEKRLHAVENHFASEKNRIQERMEQQANEHVKANDDLSNLLNDYNHLNSNKASLEYEIQVYKRLLDSQLNRLGAPKVEQRDLQQATTSSGAFGGKVTNKKEKKGPVGISDATPDGKSITLENSNVDNSAVADLSGWLITRRVDSGAEVTYKIPAGVFLIPGDTLKIWSGSYFQQRTGSDLVNPDMDNWGIGISSVTRLLNSDAEEKSSLTQSITFANY
jgi:chromosome segregation ATPase